MIVRMRPLVGGGFQWYSGLISVMSARKKPVEEVRGREMACLGK